MHPQTCRFAPQNRPFRVAGRAVLQCAECQVVALVRIPRGDAPARQHCIRAVFFTRVVLARDKQASRLSSGNSQVEAQNLAPRPRKFFLTRTLTHVLPHSPTRPPTLTHTSSHIHPHVLTHTLTHVLAGLQPASFLLRVFNPRHACFIHFPGSQTRQNVGEHVGATLLVQAGRRPVSSRG